MTIGWILKSKKAAILGGMVMLALCAGIGGKVHSQKQQQIQESIAESIQAEAEAERIRQQELANRLPELSDSQVQLLDQIEDALQQGDLSAAAELMIQQGERLWVLCYDVLDGEPYLYHEGKLHREMEGKGMVLKKPSTIFYGTVKDGSPTGYGTMLQVIELDYPRYDYSLGNWKDGKLNGDGIIGYQYYKGAGEENQSVSREGDFVDDCMEGTVIYRTVNAEGTETNWNMTVKDGKLVLDENWTFDEEKQTYQLRANQNSGHAFVTSKDAAENMMFQNMIPWE